MRHSSIFFLHVPARAPSRAGLLPGVVEGVAIVVALKPSVLEFLISVRALRVARAPAKQVLVAAHASSHRRTHSQRQLCKLSAWVVRFSTNR